MSGLWGKAFRSMRLPNGEQTEDEAKYQSEWSELIEFLELMFPGYKVFGYDPGFLLSDPDAKSGSMSITAHAATLLRDTVRVLTPKSKKRAKR